jgi:hypothetical protein
MHINKYKHASTLPTSLDRYLSFLLDVSGLLDEVLRFGTAGGGIDVFDGGGAGVPVEDLAFVARSPWN